ncbi:JmjC domain protein [Dictyocaulus viviparus]|uniref:JmjC domain protein n=1 Tax=Dictyocaulus viviparus TaxID=29172 RepID=A0A0D8Y2T7_DICVI|nr:JmjC domain protein [Dictyocaulus viviparus]
MERNPHQIRRSGTAHQFEFHEFVPGPSSHETKLDCTKAVSSVVRPILTDSFSIPRHISETCETKQGVYSTTQSDFVRTNTVKEMNSQIFYQPPPSGPLIDSSSGSITNNPTIAFSSHCNTMKEEPVTTNLSLENTNNYLPPCKGVFDNKNFFFWVATNDHSAGSFSECGVCGPEKAIWVPNLSETGEPIIEATSGHGQTIKIDPVDTFWIQCDCCEKWFHGNCVGVEEYEDALIDKFHCSPLRDVILRHRFAFDDLSQAHLPPEIGTELWIKKFVETEENIPPPDEDNAVVFENGFDFMERFNRKEEWRKVFLIKVARGLELRVPEKEDNFGLHSIVEIFGRSFKVDTIDVYRQVTHSMSIGAFYDKMISKERPRLYNILSLEFSQNEAMRKIISPPILVLELSFVHKLWPDKNDLINWDPELRQIVEVVEEHRRNKPEVALFCLCGMAGSYTDFHIDFGGSSVWYHIYTGRKVFYIVEPTTEYLDLFENYQRSENKTEVFFGDLLPNGALRRMVIYEGQTLMIPSGWIHAVYTPVDSLVFGGNFIHALNAPMQLRIYEMEQRLKKEIGTEEKFLFPHFELVNWYAARSFILEHLRESNDEGNRADQYIVDAAKALLPRLKEWMRRDKEEKSAATQSSFSDVLAKLQKEINKQERVRRSLSPRNSRERCSDSVSVKNLPESNTASLLADDGAFEGNPSSSRLDSIESDSEIPIDFRIKLTKKGKSYESSVIEKPDPMLEDVNMTQMFARRSSSGRQPRPAAWLAAAVGLDELEKTSKRLEESGEQFALREPILYDAEMERACEEEEAELLREEKRKKGKNKMATSKNYFPVRTVKKKKLSTAKQRLAAKLKLK